MVREPEVQPCTDAVSGARRGGNGGANDIDATTELSAPQRRTSSPCARSWSAAEERPAGDGDARALRGGKIPKRRLAWCAQVGFDGMSRRPLRRGARYLTL